MLTPTRRGWGFSALALILWIGARLLGLHDVWSLALLVVAFVVVSAAAVVLTALMGQITASVSVSEPTPSLGDSVLITTRLSHRLPWRVRVHARWRLGEQSVEQIVEVPRGAEAMTACTWMPPRRGAVAVRLGSMTLLGPLGLAKLGLRRRERAQLLVLPPILLRLPEQERGYTSHTGGAPTVGSRAQNGGEPAGALRDFRDGDAIRQVHWKQSARQGQLLVNLPEPEQLNERSLRLETAPDAHSTEESFELAVATAATVGTQMLAAAQVLRLDLGGHGVALLDSESELLRTLAGVERGDSEPADDPGVHGEETWSAHVRGGDRAVVVTGEVTPNLRRILEREASHTPGTLYLAGAAGASNAAGAWDVVRVSPNLMPQIAAPGDDGEDDPAGPTRVQLLAGGLAIFCIWAQAILGLGSVLEPGSWLVKAVALAGAVTLGGCLARSLWTSLRSGAAIGAMLAGLTLAAWWSHDAGRLEGWWRDSGLRFEGIRGEVLASSAPMDVGGAMEDVLLLVLLMGALVSALLLVGLDGFLLAGMVPAGVLLVPVLVLGESVPGLVIVCVGGLLALLVWAGSPRRTFGAAVAAVTSLALAAGTVAWVPSARDRVWNQSIIRSPITATVPDVTVALGEDLRERSDVVAFSFEGPTDAPMRFTLATLSEFSEGRWLPQDEVSAAGSDLTAARIPDTLEPVPMGPGRSAVGFGFPITIRIEGLVSQWLPMPQSPVRVEETGDGGFEREQWMWVEGSNTARTESRGTRRGDEYRVYALSYVVGDEPREDFDGVPIELVTRYSDPADAPDEVRPYLELPNLPALIADTAEEIAGGSEDRIDAAFALQDYFRSGEFVYDESAPYEPGMDNGNPYAVMEALLGQKRGYCVHFASTFAVMARSLGIPSRVAVGYASPGGSGAMTQVSGSELHAWPEIFVDGVGWLAFEPTPGGPAVASPADAGPDPTPTSEGPAETVEPTPTGAGETSDSEGGTADPGQEGQPAEDGSRDSALAVLPWLLAVMVLALVAVPGGWRLIRRAGRWRSIRGGPHPASNAWAEVEDTAVDLGMDVAQVRARTGEAVIELLVESGALEREEAISAASGLLGAANEERYSPGLGRESQAGEALSPEGTLGSDEAVLDAEVGPHVGAGPHAEAALDVGAALDAVSAELRAHATAGQRLRARLWPRSVISRTSRVRGRS